MLSDFSNFFLLYLQKDFRSIEFFYLIRKLIWRGWKMKWRIFFCWSVGELDFLTKIYWMMGRVEIQCCKVGWAKINGFQTLRVKLVICGPKNPPPKFQFKIQSKTAWIKTRVYFSALVHIWAALLWIWGWNFSGGILETTKHQYYPQGLKSVDFGPPYCEVYTENSSIHTPIKISTSPINPN
jgi:hypothetical protein